MRQLLLISLLIVLLGSGLASAQNLRSEPVRISLERDSQEIVNDSIAPEISILQPTFREDFTYITETPELDLVGQVKDQSKLFYVSVNKKVEILNLNGLFFSSLNLNIGENRIDIQAMDHQRNISNQSFVIHYRPPVVTLADKIRKEATYYGLIIGIDEYDDQKWVDLDKPVQDAESLYQVLTTQYAFLPENVKILRNPRREDIIVELDRLRAEVTRNDNLLLFYAGHGKYDKTTGVGYWLPCDATSESSADWLANTTLVNHLKGIDSKHTLLITDACFAGSIFKTRSIKMEEEVAYEKTYELPSRKAMTSGILSEVPDESVFIKYLLQKLDENEGTYLSAQDLFGRMRNAVISNSKVVPKYGEIQNVESEGGDFIFLRKE